MLRRGALLFVVLSAAAALAVVLHRRGLPAADATRQLLERGARQDAARRPFRAVQTYLRVLRQAPDQVDAWSGLAAIALVAGQTGNARQAAQRVLDVEPGDARAHATLTSAAAASPRPTQRAGRPRAVTRRRCAMAKHLYDLGRVDDAIIALEAAAWLDERAARPHRDLANVYYLQGRLAEAIAAQRAAVARAPQSPVLRRNLVALEAALATPAAR
jgi:tetratricopeptide (TPR) repeat protein